jgi:transcriptional regulator with XRE-family HTH domain
MYQIKLNKDDAARLKKIIRQMMIKNDYTVADLANKTGYSIQYIYDYMSGKGSHDRDYRFLQAALCDELGITVGGNK